MTKAEFYIEQIKEIDSQLVFLEQEKLKLLSNFNLWLNDYPIAKYYKSHTTDRWEFKFDRKNLTKEEIKKVLEWCEKLESNHVISYVKEKKSNE